MAPQLSTVQQLHQVERWRGGGVERGDVCDECSRSTVRTGLGTTGRRLDRGSGIKLFRSLSTSLLRAFRPPPWSLHSGLPVQMGGDEKIR